MKTTKIMATSILNKIEYLVLLVAAFAAQSKISEAEAYRYLSRYGALALCEKHYGIMHTLSLEENLQTLQAYCQKEPFPADKAKEPSKRVALACLERVSLREPKK